MLCRHIPVIVPTEDEIDMIRVAMQAYILPCTPSTESEKKAFEKAVRYQVEHELTAESINQDANIPDGVRSFSIGTFSMSFAAKEGYQHASKLSAATICPFAHAVLLRAGLLYRGIPNGGDVDCL